MGYNRNGKLVSVELKQPAAAAAPAAACRRERPSLISKARADWCVNQINGGTRYAVWVWFGFVLGTSYLVR